MIRFCDKEIYSVYKDEINRSDLFGFFCNNDHITDIIAVYDYNNEFVGIITYERLIKNCDPLIQKQYLPADENIWDDAYKIFNEDDSVVYIPIFDKNNQLIYFCYNAVDRPVDKELYQISLDLYKEDYLFINELYPQIKKVCIYDLNEMAYKFYNLLLARNIPVEVYGDAWKAIFGIETIIHECSSYATMKVYSEGAELVIRDRDINAKNRFEAPYVWEFIHHIAIINRMIIEEIIKKENSMKGSNIFICRIPCYQELERHTIDEEYRNSKTITMTNMKLDTKNPYVINQIEKIYNEEYCITKEIIDSQMTLDFTNTKKMHKVGTGDNIIYIFGPCIINGNINFDKDKLINIMFNKVNEKYPNKYSIKAIELAQWDYVNLWEIYSSLSISDKDIIIFLGQAYKDLCKTHKIETSVDLDLIELFDKRSDNEAWFSDLPIHTTGIGNQAIADELMKSIIEPEINRIDFSCQAKCLQKGRALLSEEEINNLNIYIEEIKKFKFITSEDDSVGAIVMNCNPMTLGHMYLIEYAKSKVDYLYIFVVEEDKSFFKFDDRYEIIKKATEHIDNLRIIPSGKFIISSKTMPAYFLKESIQEEVIDASEDIEVFCEYIAPSLNIMTRFAGEEPFDNITKQYNMEMRRTLTDYGMSFIEIPRKEIGGEVISASRVRKLLAQGKMEDIKKIVPAATYEYLLELEKLSDSTIMN